MICITPTSVDQNGRFEYAVCTVLNHEGGLTNHPSDTGEITNWGISLKYLKDIGVDINQDGYVNDKDIRILTVPEAKQIYKKNWWDKYNYNSIYDLKMATKVFDLSVNMGSSQCHKLLQRAINDVNKSSLTVDGALGPKTVAATNKLMKYNGQVLLDAFSEQAKKFYTNLVFSHPKLKPFIKGWIRRSSW